MATKIYAKHDDTYTPMKVNADLTGATVRVLVRPSGATGDPLEPTFSITNYPKGELLVTTQDLTPGVYECEVEVTQGANGVFTFPTRGYTYLIIGSDLG